MRLIPLLASFFIIGLAELADKTQLLTMGYALKYPLKIVIGAVFAATALLMFIAVAFGQAINLFVPRFFLQLLAGLFFIFFGLWSIYGGLIEKEEEGKAGGNKNPFPLIFGTFFVAELGDKTQLATLALVARYGKPILVWLGATMGMAGVNCLGIFAGRWLREHISDRIISFLSAVIFILFGLWTLGDLFIF